MIIFREQLIALLPIIVIGITIVGIMLSIIYSRNQFKHAVLTIIGMIIASVSSLLHMMWSMNKSGQNFFQLICIDNFSVLYVILIMFVGIASSILGYVWLVYYPVYRSDEFYLLLLIASIGGILLVITNHLIVLFLGIELISISICGLISYPVFSKKSIELSIKYIILSGVSSSFLLFGIVFIYCKTGSLSFIDIKEILSTYNNVNHMLSQPSMTLIVIGLSMMMIGMGFKLSCVPFHLWISDIYQGTPTAVSMYLATGSKIAVTAVLMRFLLILPDQYNELLHIFLSVSACCSMLFGSLMAIPQISIKRMLAYSSITNAGYLLIALIALRMNNCAIIQESISVYLVSYLFANVGVWGIVNIVSTAYIQKEKNDADTIYLYHGLFWREPMLSVIFVIAILSLAGIPMTFGFIGKFYLLFIGISNQLWFLTVMMIISSIISMFYYLKIITNLFNSNFVNNTNINYDILKKWMIKPEGFMVIIVAIIILFFGVYPQFIVNLIQQFVI
ncbi:NADH dehydrogenase I chain N [Candidatus Blochmanniella floridana]|uniref:NADH-quinone oxidoreductase subunit N n=1 Tax=Blochmanniella floridana TaxID=203907 RepID=NUON_BLOFL|nr:RecName: Full=NADH-quinone oxidoreductase subunit N; AltName: Full=NADH dehydrogenase I subunit N; AltName: Full=NDH-1 subunit N [Candidatus Blochmannia floridanus]CAD83170.1 NADH dehydrogenase I chain N [Candidatus Blochmannia floridanus]